MSCLAVFVRHLETCHSPELTQNKSHAALGMELWMRKTEFILGVSSPQIGPGGSSLHFQLFLSLLPSVSPYPPSPCLFSGHL